jgi:hypothetical protein
MTNKIKHISCVLIVKDAQATIYEVLDALKDFEDIVVYSNNSTDKTDEIAGGFKNVNLINGEFLGFGATKNKASTYAKNNWILSLDSDEVVSSNFINNLRLLKLQDDCIYSILRTNYYKTTQIKYCWGDDNIVRLYNRDKTTFSNEMVHEKIIINDLQIKKIDGEVKHYPYSTITDFITKANTYSTLFAKNNMGKKKSSPTKAILNGIYSFIKTYFFKRGFLDGYAGLIIAFSHMVTNFYKYIKLYELNQELENK